MSFLNATKVRKITTTGTRYRIENNLKATDETTNSNGLRVPYIIHCSYPIRYRTQLRSTNFFSDPDLKKSENSNQDMTQEPYLAQHKGWEKIQEMLLKRFHSFGTEQSN